MSDLSNIRSNIRVTAIQSETITTLQDGMCNKFRYLTRKIAKRALKEMNKSGRRAKKLTNVYECECGYWHTTSIRAKKSRNITKYGFKQKRRKAHKSKQKLNDITLHNDVQPVRPLNGEL